MLRARSLRLPAAILALGLVCTANTCSDKAALPAQLAQGKWELVSLAGSAVQMPEGVEMPYISLDSSGTNLTGFAGCNRMFGTVITTGDSIRFPGLASTRMYCEATQDVENRFLEALNNAQTFTIGSGELVLQGKTGQTVLRRLD